MKFICLSYLDEATWAARSTAEQEAMFEECFAYDEVLVSGGHWLDGGASLQSVRAAKTLRRCDSKVLVTDGPFAETKEQLGGIGVIEAQDMDHAVELLSKHPSVRYGNHVEVRPVDEALDQRCGEESFASSQAEGVKIACFGFFDETRFSAMSAGEREAMIEGCIAYKEELAKFGPWCGDAALQSSAMAKTIRPQSGQVLVTDGPFAETKEQLGGVVTYRFKDMDQAVQAWSNHPCLHTGHVLELRPVDEQFEALVEARLHIAQAGKQ